MKTPKHSQNLEARDTPGAGWEIFCKVTYGVIDGTDSQQMTDPVMIFRLMDAEMCKLGFERWVQFPTKAWDAMQAANAKLFAASPEGYEIASEILRACDSGAGREISTVTRQEMEPLRKLAEAYMAKVHKE